jgi:hypothetical protein
MRACVLVGVSACMRTHDIHVHDMHEYVYVCGTRAVLKHGSSAPFTFQEIEPELMLVAGAEALEHLRQVALHWS